MKTFIYKLKHTHSNAEITISGYGYVYLAYRANGQNHNIDGPAWQEWDNNGVLVRQEHWVNGKITSIG